MRTYVHKHPVDDRIERQGGGRFSPDKDLLDEFYPVPVGAQLLARLLVQVLQLSLREHFLLNRNTAVGDSALRRDCHVLPSIASLRGKFLSLRFRGTKVGPAHTSWIKYNRQY